MRSETLPSIGRASSPRETGSPIAVVGGSAAGLFTALLLARGGRSVRVFERSETIAPAARTLIVTHRVRDLLGSAAERSIVNEIRRFELFTDGRSASFHLNRPDLIIERRAVIQSLADEARIAGADIALGRRFHALHPNGEGVTLEIKDCSNRSNEEVRARTVVAADGVSSRVARAAGWAPVETVPLVQALVPLPKDMSPDTARIWFIPHETPYFYWLIPESPTRGALGLIGDSGPAVRQHLENFLEKRKLDPIEFQGSRVPAYSRWIPVRRKLGPGDVYVVGDAAGQVKVTTVGGIVTGFRGALGVAQAILHGANRELRALRRELDLHLLLRRSLHHFQQTDYSQLVDLLNDPARQSLSCYSRDDAWKVLWNVCLRQPRLILLGIRGLLMRGASSRVAND
ncbi:MAG TPA: NAD(P)/FAD-dependent oxidoreductase [Candidatus Acidoferrum sp.]|nr:NAD(P)/FAD-dependent oxidoreductase [Candidatus Acidoferrum sp.]